MVLVGILIVVGIVSAAALVTIPITHRFSDDFNANHQFGGVTMVAPVGSQLALNWSVSGGPASVSVYNGYGQVLYESDAPSGTFSFTSATHVGRGRGQFDRLRPRLPGVEFRGAHILNGTGLR